MRIKAVLGQDPRPARSRADSVMCVIQVDEDVVTRFQVGCMPCSVEVVAGPTARGQVEGWGTGESDAMAVLCGHSGPSDFGAIPVLLWKHVWGLQRIHQA